MAINDVPAGELIEKTAKELQSLKEFTPPAWAAYAKTGAHKQRPPSNPNWWYFRAAAVLRKVAVRGPIGVQKLRVQYGGKRNRGMAPEHFFEGSGNILRKVLQQLEKAGFAKQAAKGLHKGRIATPKGISFISKVADSIMKEKGIVFAKMPEQDLKVKKEAKPKKPSVPRKRAPKKAKTETVQETKPEAVQTAPAAPVTAVPAQ